MMVSVYALAALAAAQTFTPSKPVTPSAPAPVATLAPAPKQAVILSAPTESVLRAGTEVPLVMSESITTNGKKLRIGQRVRMAVASDVRLGTSVVIPAGSLAEGEVTDVRNKGMWGKSGNWQTHPPSLPLLR